ncbi:flagellar basal body P-ring protein FlgI [Aureliella helgolandensis]|uniref:Flagellar P-ring protein n=1 Tax=Aureliella helgolandensis TaxID=2527968 RepID=A0A518G901_9BACT|nr:flagellar basal body P-ring protein FlgI [Aureliella helgolandensis]QDV25052.1 Flagellar P-ring protein precursor [Aureliella helgolandensis]
MNRPDALNRIALQQAVCGALAWLAMSPVTVAQVAPVASVARSTSIPQSVVTLRDVCRLKGQEENTLQGWGLVVGLKGTGDSDIKPTMRALARATQLMGASIATDAQGVPLLDEVGDAGNVAQVMVTAKIPAAGAQQGDRLDCEVNAINAKSLEGGRLMLAYLLGPRADQPVVYALAEGRISLPNPSIPTSGAVFNGCKMEATVTNAFSENGKITLILDRDLASFSNAVFIGDAIDGLNQGGLTGVGAAADSYIATKAIDAHHVEVMIPNVYRDEPVKFVSLLMDIALTNIKKNKRVVINEREGVIVMGEDVLINPVAINHKNLSIDARPGVGGFAGLDSQSPVNEMRPKLKNLVDALNGLNVPTADMIAIIRTLDRNGDLYGEVIFE